MIGMHRFILGITDPKIKVDHKNGNALDNQKINLRTCTHAQNIRNSRKRSNSSSPYKGVYRSWSRWKARIVIDGKNKHLGTFSTAFEAAEAYNRAALEHYGEFASINDLSNRGEL